MFVTITDEMRKNLFVDGSILKRLRCSGGISHGILAGGVAMLVCAALVSALFFALDVMGGVFLFGGVCGFLGLIMVLIGRVLHNKRIRGYLDYYQKLSGLGTEELNLVDREIQEPGTILIGHPLPGKKKDYSLGCFITKHYLLAPLPGGDSYLRRIEDLAAAVYSNEVPGAFAYVPGLTFLAKNDEKPGYNSFLLEDECVEIMSVLKERNPKIITEQKFFYKGKQYDVMKEYKEVAQLFREVHG